MNKKEYLSKLAEIQKEEIKLYNPEIFGWSEFVSNDLYKLQIRKIKLFKKFHKNAYLIKVNYYEGEGKPRYVKYIGQKIYNFDYDFVVPKKDLILLKLIQKLNNKKKLPTLKDYVEITNRVKKIGGINLIWS